MQSLPAFHSVAPSLPRLAELEPVAAAGFLALGVMVAAAAASWLARRY